MAKALVITHNDFDGIFSGAMILQGLRKRKIVPELVIATPRNLAKTLTVELGRFTLPDEIYVADLAVNADLSREIMNLMMPIKESGKTIIWIDHHRWESSAVHRIDGLCTQFILDPKQKTAAALIMHELYPDDPDVAKLFRLLYHKPPEVGSDWANAWLAYLSAANDARSPEKIKQAILKLAYKDRPGGFAKFSQWFSRLGRRKVAIADVKVREAATRKGKKLLVADLRGTGINISARYRELVDMYSPHIYIAVLDNTRYQCGNGIRGKGIKETNFGPLHGTRQHGSSSFEIRGHKYVISVSTKLAFMSNLKSMFSKKYPQEVDDFIDLIQERY